MIGTFAVANALWSTVGWCSYKFEETGARWGTIYFSALSIWTARGRVARALCLWNFYYLLASNERISRISRRATAYGVVVDYLATTVYSASAGARINTLLVQAGSIQWTFCTANTFRSASWGAADVAGNTRAYRLTIYFSTLTVRATRWWIAWIFGQRF